MAMATYNLFVWTLLYFLQVSAQQGGSVEIVGPKDIPAAEQTYNWSPQYFCRLLAHSSIVLENGEKHLLVFDGGMAKYNFKLQGNNTEILDLNAWTVVIDLSRSFNTQDYGSAIVSQTKKPIGVPVVNRAVMWTDSSQNSIIFQGGHFYSAPGWNESLYHVNNTSIPPYSVWKFDLSTEKWTDITELGNKKDKFRRALAGAGVSVPSINRSFYAGGIVTSRSDKDAPANLYAAQAGMLIYDHNNNNLFDETYGTSEEAGFGFWHGSLNYMKLGSGKGFLISLMGEFSPAGVTRPDAPEVNDETGDPVDFNAVLLFSLDENRWYKQKTTSIDDDKPVTRTRFCAQTIYSKTTNTWEYWLYGGQDVTAKAEGVDDIYVLSMPSFIWTKIKIPQGESHIRTHTCHAVGSQLLVVGGYPPGYSVDPKAECASELVRVFDMNSLSWTSYYYPGTVYSTPRVVRKNAELGGRAPYLKPWADPVLKEAFNYTDQPPPPTPEPDTGGSLLAPRKIVTMAISCILATILWL